MDEFETEKHGYGGSSFIVFLILILLVLGSGFGRGFGGFFNKE